MIPEEKKNAVKQALQTAFGVSAFEDIRALTAGLSSALIFRIAVKGKHYLLRVITRTDAMADPAHWYGSMKAAANAGLAPRVWYASMEDRVLITDFIEARPFPVAEARIKMPAIIKRLHALSSFPNRLNYLDVVNNFIQKLQAAELLPERIIKELQNNYTKIISVYPRNPDDQVASHNDLKPENFLFDGEQVWLVDWEAAFLNDRYFDLAIVANFVVTNEEEERDYLQGYFEEDITEYHLARFFLILQALHVAYFIFFMFFGAASGEQIDVNLPIPDFRDFNNRVWTGEISLATNDTRQQYAWTHLAQLRHNLDLKRFEDSMRIVAGDHKNVK